MRTSRLRVRCVLAAVIIIYLTGKDLINQPFKNLNHQYNHKQNYKHYPWSHSHTNTRTRLCKNVCASTHLACENAAATVTKWGCNHGDYKLVILWSPDWWTFEGYVPSCHKSPDTHTHRERLLHTLLGLMTIHYIKHLHCIQMRVNLTK